MPSPTNQTTPWSTVINVAIGLVGFGMILVLILSTVHKGT